MRKTSHPSDHQPLGIEAWVSLTTKLGSCVSPNWEDHHKPVRCNVLRFGKYLKIKGLVNRYLQEKMSSKLHVNTHHIPKP